MPMDREQIFGSEPGKNFWSASRWFNGYLPLRGNEPETGGAGGFTGCRPYDGDTAAWIFIRYDL